MKIKEGSFLNQLKIALIMELPKNYDPKQAEAKWQKFWEDEDLYVFKQSAKKKTYSIDTPPSTVSGKMHIGHAFSYAQQDIVVRYQRMKGMNVFFPFGTDDNGLPTERLVEKKKNILSTKLKREEFVAICNAVIKEEKPIFIQSWKSIGMSADFKRSYSTINEHCQITSQASFIDLFNKGRIYQQESPVTWCMSCQTAIAQAEFESVDLNSMFNEVAFKCEDKELIISTTRPEMLPACVGLFYHPDDKRYRELEGKKALVPIFNYEVPILADENVALNKGTGLMMVCTFGDKEDVDKWFRHKLDLRIVFESYGKMNELAGEFKGLKIKEARKVIIDKLRHDGVLKGQKEITHAVNVHERCKTEIEFLKSKQWYIKVLDKKQELLDAGAQMTWYPEHMKVRYDHWVQNLNWDWCISRQRHFGIPIPVWKCLGCGEFIVPEVKELPVDPTVDVPKKKCKCGSKEFVGESDVLDTWATSSVTPEIANNWMHKGEYNFKYDDKPFSLRPQAHDIIRTWLFYTIVKSVLHHKRVPWEKVMISGHAQDPHGRKMSKSLGNIVEPMEMISKFSADALRFWAAGSKLGDDLPFMEKDLLTGQKFVVKLFNASKFGIMHLEDYDNKGKVSEVFDKWILSKLHKVIMNSTLSLDKYEYSRTKQEVDVFFWHVLCDNYLEIVKDRLYNPNVRGVKERKSAQKALYESILGVLKLMAPIMPHITEEVYQMYFVSKEKYVSIHVSAWPEYDEKLIDSSAEEIGDIGVDIINCVRKFKSENQLSMKEEIKELIIVDDVENKLKLIEDDLRAVLNVRKIVYSGKTDRETTEFKLKIGIVR